MKVLILGADGFIGRHLAFGLRAEGAEVIASARRVKALAEMGFDTIKADLTNPATHRAGFWRPHLQGTVHVINAAGLLSGSESEFEAVHVAAPSAVLAALDKGRMVHISAVGIDSTETPFARWRRAAEAALGSSEQVTILRPGLVLGDSSYGGSSLLRAFAALPWLRPVVGSGEQPFNPIHADDLARICAECLRIPPGPGIWEIGGPETLSQSDLGALYRRWLGRPPARVLRLPTGLARSLGRIGEALRFGPISATAVAQLEAGVTANSTALLERVKTRPRSVTAFVMARPAGTQDLWHARLYLLKPLIRLLLAILWLGSALAGILTPDSVIYALLPDVPQGFALLMARAGGVIDLMIGIALLGHWRPRFIAWAQLVIVLGYTVGLSALAPHLWLEPLGGLLKNLPILALLTVHLALLDER